MSLLWRDQIRIVMSPQQIAMIRLAKGWRRRITGQCVIPCSAAKPGEAPWRSALAAVETALPEFGARKADVVVLLSNHFVRYALVTESDQISSVDEEQALVRYSFSSIYGAAADHWALRLSDIDGGDGKRVASAVDQELPQALAALLQPTQLKLRSIQPYLMAAFNQWRHRFKKSAWFALVEQGGLCLVKFQNRRWDSIKSIKIGEDWLHDLTIYLERERVLSGVDAADDAPPIPVFVCAPGCSEITQLQMEEESLQLLHPSLPPGGDETSIAPFAMALIG